MEFFVAMVCWSGGGMSPRKYLQGLWKQSSSIMQGYTILGLSVCQGICMVWWSFCPRFSAKKVFDCFATGFMESLLSLQDFNCIWLHMWGSSYDLGPIISLFWLLGYLGCFLIFGLSEKFTIAVLVLHRRNSVLWARIIPQVYSDIYYWSFYYTGPLV